MMVVQIWTSTLHFREAWNALSAAMVPALMVNMRLALFPSYGRHPICVPSQLSFLSNRIKDRSY